MLNDDHVAILCESSHQHKTSKISSSSMSSSTDSCTADAFLNLDVIEKVVAFYLKTELLH